MLSTLRYVVTAMWLAATCYAINCPPCHVYASPSVDLFCCKIRKRCCVLRPRPISPPTNRAIPPPAVLPLPAAHQDQPLPHRVSDVLRKPVNDIGNTGRTDLSHEKDMKSSLNNKIKKLLAKTATLYSREVEAKPSYRRHTGLQPSHIIPPLQPPDRANKGFHKSEESSEESSEEDTTEAPSMSTTSAGNDEVQHLPMNSSPEEELIVFREEDLIEKKHGTEDGSSSSEDDDTNTDIKVQLVKPPRILINPTVRPSHHKQRKSKRLEDRERPFFETQFKMSPVFDANYHLQPRPFDSQQQFVRPLVQSDEQNQHNPPPTHDFLRRPEFYRHSFPQPLHHFDAYTLYQNYPMKYPGLQEIRKRQWDIQQRQPKQEKLPQQRIYRPRAFQRPQHLEY